jgi:hypothetical protein
MLEGDPTLPIGHPAASTEPGSPATVISGERGEPAPTCFGSCAARALKLGQEAKHTECTLRSAARPLSHPFKHTQRILHLQACSEAPGGHGGGARISSRDGRGGGQARRPRGGLAGSSQARRLWHPGGQPHGARLVARSPIEHTAGELRCRRCCLVASPDLRHLLSGRCSLAWMDGSILGAKLRSGAARDPSSPSTEGYNGAEAGDTVWEHEPLLSFRETTTTLSLS